MILGWYTAKGWAGLLIDFFSHISHHSGHADLISARLHTAPRWSWSVIDVTPALFLGRITNKAGPADYRSSTDTEVLPSSTQDLLAYYCMPGAFQICLEERGCGLAEPSLLPASAHPTAGELKIRDFSLGFFPSLTLQ